MSGDELQLFIDAKNAALVLDDAVFVRSADVFHVAAPMDEGQAAVERLYLEARVADRLIGFGMAHHRGQDEERVLPFALVDAAPVLVPDAAVVCIHERVTAALQLVVNAGIRLEIIGARAAARD